MRQGTTPTHTFTFADVDPASLGVIRVIYKQEGKKPLVKTGDDLEIEGNTVKVKLTQEETLAFSLTAPIEIQLRALTAAGDAIASGIFKKSALRCLEDEVLK